MLSILSTLTTKSKPLKKILFSFLLLSILMSACSKHEVLLPQAKTNTCELQTANPTGKSYSSDSIVTYTCTSSHCGILPLNNRNYWIYEDSIFTNGVFTKIQLDTLRFDKQVKSVTDGLVWWKSNINVGLPETLYANDSSFFALSTRVFVPDVMDAKKEFGLITTDSLRFLSSFEDMAAQARLIKYTTPVATPAGTFNNCLFYEKNARYYRNDQVLFKPGVGVVKYVQTMYSYASRKMEVQKIATLVDVHFE